jgi:hypothetical protein
MLSNIVNSNRNTVTSVPTKSTLMLWRRPINQHMQHVNRCAVPRTLAAAAVRQHLPSLQATPALPRQAACHTNFASSSIATTASAASTTAEAGSHPTAHLPDYPTATLQQHGNTCPAATSVKDFFRHKTVLLTGVTGFLGKVVLEKLLRLQPDVHRVYLLVQPSKEQDADARVLQVMPAAIMAAAGSWNHICFQELSLCNTATVSLSDL